MAHSTWHVVFLNISEWRRWSPKCLLFHTVELVCIIILCSCGVSGEVLRCFRHEEGVTHPSFHIELGPRCCPSVDKGSSCWTRCPPPPGVPHSTDLQSGSPFSPGGPGGPCTCGMPLAPLTTTVQLLATTEATTDRANTKMSTLGIILSA